MKPRRRPCKIKPVSKSRWLAYATAGAASMIAGEAGAAVHYSGILDIKVRESHHRVRLPLDQPGDSIVFEHRSSIFNFPDQWAGFKAYGLAGASFRGPGAFDYTYVSKLQRNDVVSQGNFTQANFLSGFGLLGGYISGYFIDPGIGFIGFSFDSGAGKQYGWARVHMTGYLTGNHFEIVDYAYADPGEPIRAGQTTSRAQETPAVGSLGLLAVGAAGLVAWRKHRTRLED